MYTHYCTRSRSALYGHLTLCLNIEWAFTNVFPEPQQRDISKCGCSSWGFCYCLYYLKFWVLTDLVWLYSSIQQELSQTCNTFLHSNNHCSCRICPNNTPTVMTLDTSTMSRLLYICYKLIVLLVWDVTLCDRVKGSELYKASCYLHLQA